MFVSRPAACEVIDHGPVCGIPVFSAANLLLPRKKQEEFQGALGKSNSSVQDGCASASDYGGFSAVTQEKGVLQLKAEE
ncbi:hypothetical protein CDAR_241381 [Caerostris darwini]|uniref:Uncharacterized protein n=1 Tax=Caerostris darwini TaxID=1538125 RepID=A0AAV4TI87_9ARAC|nr:hypothetical protein CDAR_241381 [Caerostris darwini]